MSTAPKEYKLVYTSDNSDALTKTAALVAELMKLDQLADQVKVKLKGMMTGVGPAMGNASRGANNYANALGGVTIAATHATAALNGTTTAATGLGASMKGVRGGLNGISTSLAGFGVATLAVHELRQAFEAVKDVLKDVRDFARETAEFVGHVADDTRELAALRNQTPDDKLSAEVVKLMTESGATPKEAADFSTLFHSTIPAARKKGNILPGATKAEQDDMVKFMEVETAKFAVRTGMDPKTAATLGGAIGIGQPIHSRGEFLSQLGMVGTQLNEGVGNITPLVNTVLKLRGTMVRKGGATESIGELAAIVGVGSLNDNPAAAGTRIDQAFRELNKFGDKKHDAFYQKVGITSDMSFLDRIRAVSKFINEANRPGGKGGQAALYGEGLHYQAANNALIKFAGELPVLEREVARAKAGGNPAEVMALNRRFAEEDPTRRFEEARKAQAKFLRGLEMKEIEKLRGQVEAEMVAGHQLDTVGSGAKGSKQVLGVPPWLSLSESRPAQIDKELAIRVFAESQRSGVPLTPRQTRILGAMSHPENPLARGISSISQAEQARVINEIMPQIRAAAKARGNVPMDLGVGADAQMNGVINGPAVPANIPGVGAAGPGAGVPQPGGPMGGPHASNSGMGGHDPEVPRLLRELVAMERRKLRDNRGGGSSEPIGPAGGGRGPVRV